MEIIIMWILFSFIVGVIGSGRKIGAVLAIFLSLILSPIIGLIITLVSESNTASETREKTMQLQEEQTNILKDINKSHSSNNIISELSKLSELKSSGAITEEEFVALKADILKSSGLENALGVKDFNDDMIGKKSQETKTKELISRTYYK